MDVWRILDQLDHNVGVNVVSQLDIVIYCYYKYCILFVGMKDCGGYRLACIEQHDWYISINFFVVVCFYK